MLAGAPERCSRGRLVKCLSLSYWIYVPAWMITLAVQFSYNAELPEGWDCVAYDGGIEWYSEAAEIISRSRFLPYVSTLDVVNVYFALLVTGWQCCALHVVSKCSVRVSVVVGVVFGLSLIVPWAVGRFW